MKIRGEEEKIRVERNVSDDCRENTISAPPTFTAVSSLPFLHVIKPIVTFN